MLGIVVFHKLYGGFNPKNQQHVIENEYPTIIHSAIFTKQKTFIQIISVETKTLWAR